jgi:hypothetical protein
MNDEELNEIGEKIENMGYEHSIYYNDDIVEEIYIYPKLDYLHRGFIIESDIIDYLDSLGFEIEYAVFFGDYVGMWFKRKESDKE